MESVFEEIKNKGVALKPVFKKLKHIEIVAEGEGIVVGKYENVFFVSSTEEIEFESDAIDLLEIEIVDEDGLENFKFGKYSIEEDDHTKLKLRVEFSEDLFYDLIPAQQILFTKVKIFTNQLKLQAEVMSKEETRILKEVSYLSERAKTCENVYELEDVLQEVSTFHMDFFRKFSQFKDVNEELFSSIVNLEVVTDMLGGWYANRIKEIKEFHQSLIYFESKFEQTLNGIRDLFSLISLQLDISRNRENMDIQRRTSSLQAAAVVIEFVAVLYYSLKVWEYFVDIDVMPKWLSFSLLIAFTVMVVAYTEVLAEIVRTKKSSPIFVTATLSLILVIVLMYVVPSIIFSGA
jgi:hypothetical protein